MADAKEDGVERIRIETIVELEHALLKYIEEYLKCSPWAVIIENDEECQDKYKLLVETKDEAISIINKFLSIFVERTNETISDHIMDSFSYKGK